MKVTLKNVRAAFTEGLFRKGEYEGKETSYGVTLLLPPKHPGVLDLKKAIKAVRDKKWGDKQVRLVRDNPLRPCEEKDHLAGFLPGWSFCKANNATKPSVFDNAGRPVAEDDGVIYSGCWVDAIVEVYPQDHKSFGKAINLSLLGVRFRRDDDAFAGGAPAKAEDFEWDDEGLAPAGDDEDDDYLS